MSGVGMEHSGGPPKPEPELTTALADVRSVIDRALELPTAWRDEDSALGFGLSRRELIGVSRQGNGEVGTLYSLTVYGGRRYPRNPYRAPDRTVLNWWVPKDGTVSHIGVNAKRFSSTGPAVEFPDPQEVGPGMIDLVRHAGIEWFNPRTHRVGVARGPCGLEAVVVPRRRLLRIFRHAGSSLLESLRR